MDPFAISPRRDVVEMPLLLQSSCSVPHLWQPPRASHWQLCLVDHFREELWQNLVAKLPWRHVLVQEVALTPHDLRPIRPLRRVLHEDAGGVAVTSQDLVSGQYRCSRSVRLGAPPDSRQRMPSTKVDPNRHVVCAPSNKVIFSPTSPAPCCNSSPPSCCNSSPLSSCNSSPLYCCNFSPRSCCHFPPPCCFFVVLADALQRPQRSPRMHCRPAPLRLFAQRRACAKHGMTKRTQGDSKLKVDQMRKKKIATLSGLARRLTSTFSGDMSQ